MGMRLSRSAGTPNIGVSTAVSESLAFTAPDADPQFLKDLEETLGVEVVQTTLAGSHVVGSLMAMNSHGAAVTYLAEDPEMEVIRSKVANVALVEDRLNAAGNNVLVNDRGALVNPEMDAEAVRLLSDVLGVEVVPATVAGVKTVGSVCVCTDKGCVCTVDATDDDVQLIKEVLHVDPVLTTVNHGSRYLAAGIIANSKGAVIGDGTTPIEMGRIEDGLMLRRELFPPFSGARFGARPERGLSTDPPIHAR